MKNAMKRLFLLLCCICSYVLLLAGPIDLEKAQKNAMEFVNKKALHRAPGYHVTNVPQDLRLVQMVMTEKSEPAYYVFDKTGGGFVIAAGNDLAAPILGYSDNGTFNPDDLSVGMRDLLENYEKQIAFVSSQHESKPRRINDNWAGITPLLMSHWDQGKPFNTLCPIDPMTNERSITGCTAVALAQVMYYYKWPEVGNGNVSYQWHDQTLSADLSKVHFLLDKMKADYQYNTPDEDNAVATLLYNCALTVGSNFSSDETPGYLSRETLSSYFGYKDQIAWLALDETTIDDFEATIYHELENERPVLFSASGDGSHAMVIDGFQDGYFHINFGWRGQNDGYFQLTAILTSWYFFNTNQTIFYNIEPDYDPHTESHFYPESSYVLSADGTELVEWKGTETEIDMTADGAFNNVRCIKSHAFSDNSSATSVVLPAKTEVIESKAFDNCQKLESLFIQQNVSKIEPQAFAQCPYLDHFLVSEHSLNFKSQNGLLIDLKENMVVASAAGISGSIVIPDNIIVILNYAFAERQITSVKIPKSLSKIEEGAFFGCHLLSLLVLPSELQSVGSMAFKGCAGLKQISVTASTPPQLGEGAFDDIDQASVSLFVPSESMNHYLTTYGWNQFTLVEGINKPEAKKLLVYLKDGTMDSYMLSEKPVIRNEGQDLVVSTLSSSQTYKIDLIRKMQYFDEQEVPTPIDNEPYVVFNGGTLTFYCDKLRNSREGTIFNLNVDNNDPAWLSVRYEITKVVFDASFAEARPTSTYKWFDDVFLVKSIEGMQYLNTSKVTNMQRMFSGLSHLTNLDVSHFDTSNVTNMEGMFYLCDGLTSLDVSHFDTSNVTNMSCMFANIYFGLSSLDVSHFDTSNCTDMSGMFNECYKLAGLDVSNFNTSKVTNMNRMFYSCYDLTSLDVSHFDTSNVTDMGSMFYQCSALTDLDLSHFNTSKVTDMSCMFYGCQGVTNLDLTSFNTSNVTAMNHMFGWNTSLTSLDLSSFNTSLVTDMSGMFIVCKGLTTIDLSHFDTSNVTDMQSMFYQCEALSNLDLSHFNTSKVTNMSSMFSDCYSLQSLDVSHFDTSNCTDMERMFYYCQSLGNLEVGNFNTANVINMAYMFSRLKLTSLDVSGFDLSHCENTESMFKNMSKLNTFYISPTMENLEESACERIGWFNPCTLIAPSGFNFGVDMSSDTFVWKSGTFKLGVTDISDLLFTSQQPPFSHVEIFNMEGKLLKVIDVGDYSQALDLNGIGTGVFLVKINGVTYKVLRK